MVRRSLSIIALLAACTPATPVDNGPCASTTLTKGPWVMRATAEGGSVFWETRDAPSCVAIGVTDETAAAATERVVTGSAVATTVSRAYGEDLGIKNPDLAGTFYVARTDVTGLTAGHCYSYRLRSAKDAPPVPPTEILGRFCTAAPSDQPFKFFAVGDTNPILGHTIPVFQYTLPEKPDFIVHVGDMQYYSSVAETWAYWFGAMAPLLRGGGALFPSVGNHEDELGGTEYADYFDRLFHRPSLDGTPRWYRFNWGGVWFHTVDTEEPYDSASPQYLWLADSLKEVTQKPGFRFSVVYMHRNLYTLGDANPQIDRRLELGPLFNAHKVRLVLSGHMHGYERFEVGDLTYVTTAGGGGLLGDVDGNVANYPADVPLRLKSAARYHAMLFDVTPSGTATTLRGRAVDDSGDTFDDFTHVIP